MIDLNKTVADFEATSTDDAGFYITAEAIADALSGSIKNLPAIQRKHTIIYDAVTEGYMVVAGDLLDERIKARS